MILIIRQAIENIYISRLDQSDLNISHEQNNKEYKLTDKSQFPKKKKSKNIMNENKRLELNEPERKLKI